MAALTSLRKRHKDAEDLAFRLDWEENLQEVAAVVDAPGSQGAAP